MVKLKLISEQEVPQKGSWCATVVRGLNMLNNFENILIIHVYFVLKLGTHKIFTKTNNIHLGLNLNYLFNLKCIDVNFMKPI